MSGKTATDIINFNTSLRVRLEAIESFLKGGDDSNSLELDIPSAEELKEEIKTCQVQYRELLAQGYVEAESDSLITTRLLTVAGDLIGKLDDLKGSLPKEVDTQQLELLQDLQKLRLKVFRMELKEGAVPLTDSQELKASDNDLLQTGHILGDRYKIEGVIGSGGTSAVYLAHDTRTPQSWAVKELRNYLGGTDGFDMGKQLQAEVQTLSRLRHPNLPRIVDAFVVDDRHYIIMDYISGRDLKIVFKETGALPLPLALDLGIQISGVLSYLHFQPHPIIFRDLKPGNIMLEEGGRIKLVDFGIARFFQKDATSDTQALGTPGYAAPEQYGKGQSDPRTDIYALGATLHELVTGRNPNETPFSFPSVCDYRPDAPPELATLIAKCVAVNPNDRYQSMREVNQGLKDVLQQIAAGSPTAAGPALPEEVTEDGTSSVELPGEAQVETTEATPEGETGAEPGSVPEPEPGSAEQAAPVPAAELAPAKQPKEDAQTASKAWVGALLVAAIVILALIWKFA